MSGAIELKLKGLKSDTSKVDPIHDVLSPVVDTFLVFKVESPSKCN